MKKEELIISEIYTSTNGNIVQYETFVDNIHIKGFYIGDKQTMFGKYKSSPFEINKLRLATPEEKHWLETCIKEYRFVSYDEAMKTFVPEKEESEVLEQPKDKVLEEDIRPTGNKIIKVECAEGGVYKITDQVVVFDKSNLNNNKPCTIIGFRWTNNKTELCAITTSHQGLGIRLSKIELYVEPKVKDDFVLPEKWCVKITENSKEDVCNWFQKNRQNNYNGSYLNIVTNGEYMHYPLYSYNNSHRSFVTKFYTGYTEITFEQFKKYVLHE